LESLEHLAERRGLHTSMGEATIEERRATSRELAGLGQTADSTVTVVTRVILADGQRVAHLTDVVPLAHLRPADLRSPAPAGSADFHGSVLDHFLARGWPALSHSRTELAAEAADADLARALHVQRGAPLLRLEAQLYAQDGTVVDYSTSYFVPGYFRFHVVRRIG
jgi:GntR family transcriptional regulator